MGYVVRMPQLGMTMEVGVVVEWPVGDGPFEAGDVIAVVESEKTTNEVEAREDGVLIERFVDLDEPVEPGAPVAYVDEPGAEVPEEVRTEVEGAVAPAVGSGPGTDDTETDEKPVAQSGDGRGPGSRPDTQRKISPRARSYADAHDIAPEAAAAIDGSGPNGAVIEADVIEVHEAGIVPGQPDDVPTAVADREIYEVRDGSRLRRSVARQMSASARDAPQVTLNRRVSVADLLAIKSSLESDLGIDVSISDFVLKAVANALATHPEFNAIYEDERHKLARNVNIGIAVDLDDGLVTPVLEKVDELSLETIASRRAALVERTQARDYTADDLEGGTFTVTNLGPFGVETFDPLLNVPEVGILGVGSIVDRPAAGNATEPVLNLSLTFDHRPNDGADAAKFLESIAHELERPMRLVSERVDWTERDHRKAEAGGPFIERPDTLEGGRRAQAVSQGSMQATVRSRRFEWRVDEPVETGGRDTAPTPVEQFLGSLAACLTLTIEVIANRRGIEIETVAVDVSAEPDHNAIESLLIEISIGSSADRDDLELVVETAERACYVSRAISDDIDRSTTIEIERP